MRYREEEDMKKPVAGIRPGIAAGVTAVTAVCCLRSDWERKHFVTTEYTLRTKKTEKEKTFVFLSDLHDNCFGQGQEELLAAIHKAEPDGVLIGGDMMVVKKKADLRRTPALPSSLTRTSYWSPYSFRFLSIRFSWLPFP